MERPWPAQARDRAARTLIGARTRAARRGVAMAASAIGSPRSLPAHRAGIEPHARQSLARQARSLGRPSTHAALRSLPAAAEAEQACVRAPVATTVLSTVGRPRSVFLSAVCASSCSSMSAAVVLLS